MRHVLAGPAVALLAGFFLVGCSESVVACADWVDFDSPQEMYDEAEAVFVTSEGERAGTTRIYGVDAHSYEMQVEEVLKGDLSTGTIRISSTPITCTEGNQYPDGDPLDTTDTILVFANKPDGEWFTLTPYYGTLPYTEATIGDIQR